MKITLNQNQLDWCKNLAMKRSGSMNHANTKNSTNFFKDKPGWWRHYVGACGELAYAILTNQKVDTTTIGKGDTGIDFKDGVDVKSINSSFRPNRLLLLEKQFNRKIADSYVLAWCKLPEIELLGSIKRNKIMEVKENVDYGYGNSYYIGINHLNKII
tara:strand:- start:1424 stop:1897 length:474 start_codon:yes stop_codon:yes gene_type:complete